MCALKIFLPPKSLRDLGAMKIFAGFLIPRVDAPAPPVGKRETRRRQTGPDWITPRAQCFQERSGWRR